MNKYNATAVLGRQSSTHPRLRYVDLRILSEILKSRHGMCICHLAGNLRMKDADVIRRVVEMLDAGLVHVLPPENPDPALLAHLEELSRGDSSNPRSEGWWDFFKSIETGPDGPAFLISATDAGRAAFTRGMRGSFRAAVIRP